MRSAPEVLAKTKYSVASDVWSFGVVCWEVATKAIFLIRKVLNSGAVPYQWLSNREVIQHMDEGSLKLPIPINCPDNVWSAIDSCFSKDPEARPTFLELSDKFARIKPTISPIKETNSNYLELNYVETVHYSNLAEQPKTYEYENTTDLKKDDDEVMLSE